MNVKLTMEDVITNASILMAVISVFVMMDINSILTSTPVMVSLLFNSFVRLIPILVSAIQQSYPICKYVHYLWYNCIVDTLSDMHNYREPVLYMSI